MARDRRREVAAHRAGPPPELPICRHPRRATASARPGARDAGGEVGEGLGGGAEGALLPHEVDEGVRRLDAEGAHLARADEHLPGESDAGTQGLRGDGGHAVGHLPGAAREVEGALAGHDQVGRAGALGQRHRRRDQLDARLPGGAEDEQGVADAACGAGALLQRRTPVGGGGEGLEPAVHLGDPVLGDALLRTEGLGGPEETGQGVVHVARRDERDAVEPRTCLGEVHGRHGPQRGGPAVEHAVGPRAEGGQDARATVVGAGPAQPDHDRRRAAGHRGQHQLAHAHARGGLDRTRGQVQPGGLCALDVRRRAHPQHHRGHRVAVRSADRHGVERAAERGVQDVDETGATVGHGSEVELVVRRVPPPAGGDRLRGLDRGEGASELVRGDQHAHGCILAARASGMLGA